MTAPPLTMPRPLFSDWVALLAWKGASVACYRAACRLAQRRARVRGRWSGPLLSSTAPGSFAAGSFAAHKALA